MSLFTRNRVIIAADRNSYIDYTTGTMSFVVDGVSVMSATSTGVDIDVAVDFEFDIVPESDNDLDVGSTAAIWQEIHGTGIFVGRDALAGTLTVYPSTTARGTFVLSTVDQDGDTAVTLTPAAMGQASVISIPDPGAGTANVMLTAAANDQSLVTATAAEVNQACDESANSEAVTGATNVESTDSGKTYFLNSTTGFAMTLPVPALGLRYRFIVSIVSGTGDHTIATDSAANILQGQIMGASTVVPVVAANTLAFDQDDADIGDWVELYSDGTSWFVNGAHTTSGGMSVT